MAEINRKQGEYPRKKRLVQKQKIQTKLTFSKAEEWEVKGVDAKFCGHTATLVGKKLVVFGGRRGRMLMKDIFTLDLTTHTWSKATEVKGVIPDGRRNHASCLHEDSLIVYGGKTRKSISCHLYKLDLTTTTWSYAESKGNKPGLRSSHSLDLVGADSRLFMFGGKTKKKKVCNYVHALTMPSLTWERVKPRGKLPAPRMNHGSCVINDSLYIFGGCNKDLGPHRFMGDIHILDTNALLWSTPEIRSNIPLPEARACMTMVFIKGKIVIFGGHRFVEGNMNYKFHEDLEIYDPSTSKWQIRLSAKKFGLKGLSGHSTVVCNDERILICGGFNYQRVLQSNLVEIKVKRKRKEES